MSLTKWYNNSCLSSYIIDAHWNTHILLLFHTLPCHISLYQYTQGVCWRWSLHLKKTYIRIRYEFLLERRCRWKFDSLQQRMQSMNQLCQACTDKTPAGRDAIGLVPNKGILVARLMGPIWGLPGAGRTQVGPMLATWTWLSGHFRIGTETVTRWRHCANLIG